MTANFKIKPHFVLNEKYKKQRNINKKNQIKSPA